MSEETITITFPTGEEIVIDGKIRTPIPDLFKHRHKVAAKKLVWSATTDVVALDPFSAEELLHMSAWRMNLHFRIVIEQRPLSGTPYPVLVLPDALAVKGRTRLQCASMQGARDKAQQLLDQYINKLIYGQ